MSKFQQLILKALSTESDHEALACLAKAKREKPEFSSVQEEVRIQGKTALEWREVAFQQHANAKFKSKTAREWYDLAEYYYGRNERLKQQVEDLNHRLNNSKDIVKSYKAMILTAALVSMFCTSVIWLILVV